MLLSAALVSGETNSYTISALGEQDVYTFQAVPGNSVTLNLALTTANFYPTVDIYSPSGAQVYDGANGGAPAFDVQLYSFSESGTYTVIVRAATTGTSVGGYALSYVKVAGTHTIPVDEGALTSGVTRPGLIAIADIDVYTFQAAPGHAVTLNLARTTTQYSLEVDIFAPNGALVYDGPVAGTASYDILLNTFQQTGTYTVIVKAADGGSVGGNYNLSYVKLAGTHTLTVDEGVLTSGVTKAGTLTPADIDVYTFQAAAGGVVTLNLARTTTEYYPEVDIFDPNGVLIFDGVANGPGAFDVLLNNFTLSGTYTVLVKASDGGKFGDYNMTYAKVADPHPLPAGEGVLTSGVTKSGTIIPGDLDVYTFSAITGDAVTINLARTTQFYKPEVDIFAPNGALVYDGPATGIEGYDLLLNTFTQNGTYTVVVKSSDAASPGGYNLSYVKVSATHTLTPDEGQLTSGVTKFGTIFEGDVDVYLFQATVGSAVTLNLSRTTAFYSPEVDIFAPNGALVYDGPVDGAVSFDILLNSFTQTGTYTVVVKDSKGTVFGDYNLTYVQIAAPHVLTPDEGALISGVTKTGPIISIILADIDVYTFPATAGNAVTLNLASTTSNHLIEVDIFAPNGVLVYDGPATGTAAYDLLLNSFTQTGTYTVVVKSGQGGGVGTYNMTYVKVPSLHTLEAGEGALTSGATKAGTLVNADLDVYTFQATVGSAVKLELARTTTGYIPEVDVFGPTGALFYDGPANGAASYNLLLKPFTLAGTYTVIVKASDGKSAGDYYIRHLFSASGVFAAASPIASLSVVPSLISAKQSGIV